MCTAAVASPEQQGKLQIPSNLQGQGPLGQNKFFKRAVAWEGPDVKVSFFTVIFGKKVHSDLPELRSSQPKFKGKSYRNFI